MTADAEAWIDLLLKRGPELRAAGVLSIGVDGYTATLAPAERAVEADDAEDTRADADDPVSPWENPASYPSGHVPSIGSVDDLPEIPEFDS